MIHDHICDEVKREVCNETFIFREFRQRNLFVFNNALVISFKRFDEQLQSRNYPTATAEKFAGQEEIEGIPANLPRIEMGYIPDAAGSAVNGIFAVYKAGKKIDWSVDLNESDDFRQKDIKFA